MLLRIIKIKICLIIFLMGFLVSPCQGQVVETKRGKVEFVGLQEWTVAELVDTLKDLNPKKSLHACAAVLTSQLGFIDASVLVHMDGKKVYTCVTVIEPKDSLRVQYLPSRTDTMEPLEAWQKGASLFKNYPGAFDLATSFYGYSLAGKADSAYAMAKKFSQYADPKKTMEIMEFFQEHNHKKDRDLAIWYLTNDGNRQNRIIAATILANFSDSNLTWWLLVRTLRDSDHRVRRVASLVLRSMYKHNPRHVNWTPVIHSLRLLLNGTNLFAFPSTLDLLQQTNISQELAKELMANNFALVLSYLQAEYKKMNQNARNFLKELSGKDYNTFEQWKKWLSQLQME